MKETERKQILITVKAYPNPNRKRGETVCCAGIDLDDYKLIRLHPVPFRDLNRSQQFKKYSIIEVDCFRPNNDHRPESYSIHCSSIKIIDHIDSERGTWRRRNSIVSKVPAKTMCQVCEESKVDGLSLGIIKPDDITFEYMRRKRSDPKKREAYYSQFDLLNKAKGVIEEIPFLFHYRFNCAGVAKCEGHKLAIVDWEICQAYREWREQFSDEVLPEEIKKKWLTIADTSKKDVRFYVGNMNRFRETFLVLGVFYPPKAI
ncbi:MAG: hypothetical protein PHR28_00395 [candidate division Zixibacteria bacterium]|nr:hypothetical protein [candidate division Zixibacteria bacterium]